MIESPLWHETLIFYTTQIGIVIVGLGILMCLARMLVGPHLADRAIALDTIAIHLIALVILLSVHLDSLVFFDGILVLSLLGFAGTVATAQYISRPHVRRGRMSRRNPGGNP